MTRFRDAVASEALRLKSRHLLLVVLGLVPAIAVGLTIMQGAVTHDDFAEAQIAFREDRAARYSEERDNFMTMRSTLGDQLPAGARDLTKDEFVAGMNFFGGQDDINSQRYDARVHVPETAGLVGAAAALVAFVLGVLAVGRDWASGTMAGVLVWHPRRTQVIVAKLAVLAPALMVAAATSFALVWVGGLIDGSMRGTTHGLTAVWWAEQALFAVRACVVGSLCVVAGAMSADLARGTSAPLGVLIGVLVLNPVVAGLLPAMRPWLPLGVLSTVFEWGERFRSFDDQQPVGSVWVSGEVALTILVLVSAGLFAIAAVVRGRRDAV